MQKNDHGAIGRAGLGIADVKHAGLDLLQGRERRVRTGLDLGQICPIRFPGLCVRMPDRSKRGGNDSDGAGG